MATIKGDKELQKKFTKLANQIKSNKAPMYKRIGIKLLNEINETFRNESHEGKFWQPLTIATATVRRGTGVKILQDTGLLRESFVSDANNDRVKVGTPVEYALTHEEGRDNIPQRKMLPSKERALEISVKIADGYIEEKIKKAGL